MIANHTTLPQKGKHFVAASKEQSPSMGRFALILKSIEAAVDRKPHFGVTKP